MATSPDGSVIILIPIFNDWTCFTELVARLDGVLADHRLSAEVLVVDDSSTQEAPGVVPGRRFRAVRCVDVLILV